jgi:hypothetical protein
MAKLNRESKLRDKRLIKAARKEQRKREAAIEAEAPGDSSIAEPGYGYSFE